MSLRGSLHREGPLSGPRGGHRLTAASIGVTLLDLKRSVVCVCECEDSGEISSFWQRVEHREFRPLYAGSMVTSTLHGCGLDKPKETGDP